KVWAPSRERWRLASEDQPGKLSLTSRSEGNGATPRWQVLGKVRLSSETPIAIEVSRAALEAKDESAEKPKKDDAKKTPPPPPPVPALLFLSTDAAAEPAAALDVI